MAMQSEPFVRRVTVNGTGVVKLMPDTATVRLGVEVRDRDLATAQTEASRRMTACIAAVRAAGVSERDSTTSGYNIWVNQDHNNPRRPITGYTVSHTLTVRVREISNVAAVIKAALEAGANEVHGIHFSVEEPGDAHTRAREAAVANAREKAEDLARITGATIGQVLTIDETSYAPQTVAGDTRMYARAMMDAAPMAEAPIEPGESSITINLQVSWEIIPS